MSASQFPKLPIPSTSMQLSLFVPTMHATRVHPHSLASPRACRYKDADAAKAAPFSVVALRMACAVLLDRIWAGRSTSLAASTQVDLATVPALLCRGPTETGTGRPTGPAVHMTEAAWVLASPSRVFTRLVPSTPPLPLCLSPAKALSKRCSCTEGSVAARKPLSFLNAAPSATASPMLLCTRDGWGGAEEEEEDGEEPGAAAVVVVGVSYFRESPVMSETRPPRDSMRACPAQVSHFDVLFITTASAPPPAKTANLCPAPVRGLQLNGIICDRDEEEEEVCV
mmetsp:Transcript_14110/g.28305  ORF Transcript_14110/g.28305 Transcript_14110/m.28305 type:complete len:283 (-) Transcript_14110:107-955(-)